MVMKETPRKRLRVPPISATIVDEWYRSSSFSTEVYLVEIKMINVNLVETDPCSPVYLDWAIMAKTKCDDLNDVGIPPP